MSDPSKEELQVLRAVFDSVGYGFAPSGVIAEKLDPIGCATNKRKSVADTKRILSMLEHKGLVRQIENQRPISWFITKAGAAILKKEREMNSRA
jgi:hypothetical protein